MARIDIFFTSWIIIWFLLYYINIFPYNPKIVLICAIIVCTIILFSMLYNNVNKIYIGSFIIIFFITKLIPYYCLKDTICNENDIYFSILLFIIYLTYLKILFGNATEIINKTYVTNLCYGEKAPIPVKIFYYIRDFFI
jgi:uncharacterized membrane protein